MKKLYRITDLLLNSDQEKALNINPQQDVVEVEEQSAERVTFLVWLSPEQVQAAAEVGITYTLMPN